MKTKNAIKQRLTYVLMLIMIISAILIIKIYPKNLTSNASEKIGLKLIADGFVSPVDLASPNDGTGRLFVLDRNGIIKVVTADGTIVQEPFLDITEKVITLNEAYDERGLLGIAFHPDFKNNGKFYVFYSIPLRAGAPSDWDCTSRISEFSILETESNRANPDSEKIILEFDKPYMNHNGGQLLFGADSYLYISTGDGGNANDVGKRYSSIGNGQDLTTYMGKILRIDINNGSTYTIPSDNPFVGKPGVKEEIYAYGFRNPWRMSFDSETGQLFVGDVGQNLWEEIDIVNKSGNYGWNIKEGTHCFNPDNPNTSPDECNNTGYEGEPLLSPIIEYLNSNQEGGLGHTNVGGFIYRGSSIPELYGRFVFGDWSKSFIQGEGTLFAAEPSQNGLWQFKELGISGKPNETLGEFLLSFSQDAENELYILTSGNLGPGGTTGKVYKLIPS